MTTMSTPIIKIWEVTAYLSRHLIFKHNDQTFIMVIGCPIWVHEIYMPCEQEDETPEYFVCITVTDTQKLWTTTHIKVSTSLSLMIGV